MKEGFWGLCSLPCHLESFLVLTSQEANEMVQGGSVELAWDIIDTQKTGAIELHKTLIGMGLKR